mgnify:CR=1 FL=1
MPLFLIYQQIKITFKQPFINYKVISIINYFVLLTAVIKKTFGRFILIVIIAPIDKGI